MGGYLLGYHDGLAVEPSIDKFHSLEHDLAVRRVAVGLGAKVNLGASRRSLVKLNSDHRLDIT